MSRVKQLTDRVRHAVEHVEGEPSTLQRAVRYAVALARYGARELVLDRAPQMAAALSFRTLFSLVPVLVVSLLVVRMFQGQEAFAEPLDRMSDFLGLDEIRLGESSAAAGGGEQGSLAPSGQSVADWIESLVERIGQLNFAAIGLVGVAVLFYAALSLLLEVEQAFNTIYHAPRSRALVSRLTNYWAILTLAPLGLIFSFYLTERFRGLVEGVGGSFSLRVVGLLATFFIAWVLLFIAYSIIPNTTVRLRPTLIGSFVAAMLWEASKFGFREYVEFSTGYSVFYGSLGLLPLFMIWIYVIWIIVLFGLELSYALQTVHTEREAKKALGGGEGCIIDPSVALLVMSEAAERFEKGATATSEQVARRAGLPEDAAQRLLHKLVERGLLRRVEDSGHERAYSLARPPDSIPAHEALRAAYALADERRGGDLEPSLRALREKHVQGLADLTLAAFLRQHGPAAPSTT